MNQIHEKDWAEDNWGGHSGMRSDPYDTAAMSNSEPRSDPAERDRNGSALRQGSPPQ